MIGFCIKPSIDFVHFIQHVAAGRSLCLPCSLSALQVEGGREAGRKGVLFGLHLCARAGIMHACKTM